MFAEPLSWALLLVVLRLLFSSALRVLADAFNPASLAEAIGWVIMQPKRRLLLGQAARQHAERLCDSSSIAELYASVCACAVAPDERA